MISAHAFIRWRERVDLHAERDDIQAALDRAHPVPDVVMPYLKHLHIVPRNAELRYDLVSGALLVVGDGTGFPRQLVTVLLLGPGIRTLIVRSLSRPIPAGRAG